MIDIHCHIIPDVDDGAASLNEALKMARMAVISGVNEIIATPHFRGEADSLKHLSTIEYHYNVFNEALDLAEIPLRLHRGAEILCMPETPELARAHKLPTLGHTDYVLTEFFFNESFRFMDETLARIARHGYKPVVAHPERYSAIQRDPELLRHWVQRGYALQLNKGSVLGNFGPRPERAANEILRMGLAHMFASDAHHHHSRTPHMGTLRSWTEEYCDREYASILLEENPRRLLQNQPMVGGE